jgi:hypothetical protein
VTLIAAQLCVLAQQGPRVFEFLGHCDVTGFRDNGFLSDDRMAKLAIFSNDLPILTDVIALMATKTAGI